MGGSWREGGVRGGEGGVRGGEGGKEGRREGVRGRELKGESWREAGVRGGREGRRREGGTQAQYSSLVIAMSQLSVLPVAPREHLPICSERHCMSPSRVHCHLSHNICTQVRDEFGAADIRQTTTAKPAISSLTTGIDLAGGEGLWQGIKWSDHGYYMYMYMGMYCGHNTSINPFPPQRSRVIGHVTAPKANLSHPKRIRHSNHTHQLTNFYQPGIIEKQALNAEKNWGSTRWDGLLLIHDSKCVYHKHSSQL